LILWEFFRHFLLIVKEWKAWFQLLDCLLDISLARSYFAGSLPVTPQDQVIYQLHGFSDASSSAYGSVVYLRRIVNGVPMVSIVFGKSKVVLRHQESWPIARKELVAAVTTAELTKQAFDALGLPGCKLYFWCDSRTVLQWIHNKDLRLDKFISRRIARILLFADPGNWRYCHTSVNPADVASRPDGVKKLESRELWFGGPGFLKQNGEFPIGEGTNVSVKRVACSQDQSELCFPQDSVMDRMIEAAPSLYVLQKRMAYLMAFVRFLKCKAKKDEFVPPKLDIVELNKALNAVVSFVQRKHYGQALKVKLSIG